MSIILYLIKMINPDISRELICAIQSLEWFRFWNEHSGTRWLTIERARPRRFHLSTRFNRDRYRGKLDWQNSHASKNLFYSSLFHPSYIFFTISHCSSDTHFYSDLKSKSNSKYHPEKYHKTCYNSSYENSLLKIHFYRW